MNKELTSKTAAVILGGGVGSRLFPLTKSRSKPAVPIAGKYRLIDIPISNCINSNIRNMFVLTMYNSASLNQHIKNTYRFDKFSQGFVDILAAEQTKDNKEWFQGTADAVRQSLPRLTTMDYDYVLILSGDQLYHMDFEGILAYHKKQNADVTIATIPVVKKDTTGFGIMKVNEKGMIDAFIEKPPLDIVDQWKSHLPQTYIDQGKDYLASMGIYVFNKESLIKLFQENKASNDFGKEIIPYAVDSSEYTVASYLYDGYWADIGDIPSFLEANLMLTDHLPRFHLYDNAKKVFTHSRMLAPTKIFGTKIIHGLISDGCIIHAELIEKSIIGVRSRIGSNTTIKNSIVMGNNFYQSLNDLNQLPDNQLLGIGNNCIIENAILDKNVKIGNDVVIRGHAGMEDIETDSYSIKQGIVVIEKGASIKSGTRIE